MRASLGVVVFGRMSLKLNETKVKRGVRRNKKSARRIQTRFQSVPGMFSLFREHSLGIFSLSFFSLPSFSSTDSWGW